MGRPPCCDKIGVKKGPWTPEEDIVLVSYIQENGPGNWRAVPTNTGLMRCSKSCRLRWTNYLRPGIKRGNFTQQEEDKIIQLQELLGNRWAAIAAYLPQRTDNDIKNYWNTHLRRKLKKLEGEQDGEFTTDGFGVPLLEGQGQSQGQGPKRSASKGQWEFRLQTNINEARQALSNALSLDKNDNDNDNNVTNYCQGFKPITTINPPQKRVSAAAYASSADNIARLLKNWDVNSARRKKAAAAEMSLSSQVVSQVVSESSTKSNCSLSSNSFCPFVGGGGGGSGGGSRRCSSPSDGGMTVVSRIASDSSPDGGFDSFPRFKPVNSEGYSLDDVMMKNYGPENENENENENESRVFNGEGENNNNNSNNNMDLGSEMQLNFLEKWLFDDGGVMQGNDDQFMPILPLGEAPKLF